MIKVLMKPLNKPSYKSSFSGALACFFLLGANVYAAEINTDSTIKAVTIYPNSAKVTRISKIALSAGDNDILINNLPVNLNESSLRASGEGVGTMTLGSVELIRKLQDDIVQERERALRNEIETLQDSRGKIVDEVSRSRSQLQYIQKMVMGNVVKSSKNPPIQQNSNGGSYTNLPLEQWQQAWQTLDSATHSAQEKIRLAEKSLRTTDKKIKKLKTELSRIAVNQTETRSAKLHVKSDSATELTLKLTYQINGARWAPVYDADLDTKSGNVHLKSLAQISQRTGEDWNDVAVTLSTLRPSAGSQLPTLNPWVIDFMPDYIAYQKRSKNKPSLVEMKQEMAQMEMDAVQGTTLAQTAPMPMAAPKPKRMAEARGQIVTADFSAEYTVPGNLSLASGSNKRRFALSTQDLPSAIRLASVPRFDPRAMILATIKYQGETPLLAGSLSLYRNGNYVGNTYLPQKLSGEDVKLSFGEDDKVKITYQPDPDKKRKDGLLFGKRKVVERHYQISINNNHDKSYDINLYDTLPFASNEEIKVSKTGDKPTTIDVDDKKGVVSWDLTLTPKNETKLKYGYTVSFPEDKVILGL